MRSLLGILWLFAAVAPAAEVRIENYGGDIHVEVVSRGPVELERGGEGRPLRDDDVQVQRSEEQLSIVCRPADGARIDLHLRVPMRFQVSAKTFDGAISLRGFPSVLTIQTVSGDLDLQAPWEATRFLMFAAVQPKKLELPKGVKFQKENDSELPGVNWIMQDRRKPEDVTYGRVRIRADKPRRVILRDMEIPPDSPVKMTWQAKEMIDRILAGTRTPKLETGRPSRPDAKTPVVQDADSSSDVMFSSEVRMVSLTAAVYDADRRPLTGLGPEDFAIVENAVSQEVAVVEPEETPFNLAILLDLSASTRHSRNEMMQIVRNFIGVARPQDRVALYALANNWFLVLSELVADRERLLEIVDQIPPLSGGSPVYDSIGLAYGHELAARPDERNALIVITDGLDNQFASTGLPSKIGHEKLVEAARLGSTLIYPVFLGNPPEEQGSRTHEARAYKRLEAIAEAAGGKVFVADPQGDFVGQVAEDLRAVYTVAYYPKDQNFSGELRSVDVQVKRPGAVVRSRDGYFAR